MYSTYSIDIYMSSVLQCGQKWLKLIASKASAVYDESSWLVCWPKSPSDGPALSLIEPNGDRRYFIHFMGNLTANSTKWTEIALWIWDSLLAAGSFTIDGCLHCNFFNSLFFIFFFPSFSFFDSVSLDQSCWNRIELKVQLWRWQTQYT